MSHRHPKPISSYKWHSASFPAETRTAGRTLVYIAWLMSTPLHPPWIDALAPAALRAVQGVLTDIDDTLTCDGRLMPAALDALQQLQAAQLPVIAITGRPTGWSEPFARTWPLAAIVAENGAVALFRDAQDCLHVEYAQDAATRAAIAQRLRAVARLVQQQVPGARLARASAGRVTDRAIDHSEFEHLDAQDIAPVVAVLRDAP